MFQLKFGIKVLQLGSGRILYPIIGHFTQIDNIAARPK